MHTPDDHTQAIRDQARRIAAQGQNIRQQIESLVKDVAHEIRGGGRKMVDIAQEVMDGAAAGINEAAPPEDRENRLRQVIDGLGDGFTRAANATRLAIEEAQSRGEHFARKDLNDTLSDMKLLGDLFVEVVSRTTHRAVNLAQKEAGDVVDHARRTMESIRPSLNQAMDAAKEDPARLTRETTEALTQATKQAAGAFLGAVGDLLKHAAGRLNPEKPAASTTANPSSTASTGSCGCGPTTDSCSTSTGGSTTHGGERAE